MTQSTPKTTKLRQRANRFSGSPASVDAIDPVKH